MSSLPTPRLFVSLGAFNCLLSVALGAFGAHLLEGRLAADLFAIYQKASTYQMPHGLGLILIGLLGLHKDSRLLRAAGWLLLAGILLFCGSLYTLGLTGIRSLGIITPFGGSAFLAGWLCLCIAAWRWR